MLFPVLIKLVPVPEKKDSIRLGSFYTSGGAHATSRAALLDGWSWEIWIGAEQSKQGCLCSSR